MIRHGDTLYISGSPPFDPLTGEIIDAPIERQTELVLEQMKLCLETAGSSLDNVLKCDVYCTSVEKFAAVNAVYVRYFPQDPPARIFINVPAWPGHFDIEIDCIAAVSCNGKRWGALSRNRRHQPFQIGLALQSPHRLNRRVAVTARVALARAAAQLGPRWKTAAASGPWRRPRIARRAQSRCHAIEQRTFRRVPKRWRKIPPSRHGDEFAKRCAHRRLG
jgi:2-iminobutanoate/2-iminopropanoate deaminase